MALQNVNEVTLLHITYSKVLSHNLLCNLQHGHIQNIIMARPSVICLSFKLMLLITIWTESEQNCFCFLRAICIILWDCFTDFSEIWFL